MVNEIYCFETPSVREDFYTGRAFAPQFFIDVEKTFSGKQKALAYYSAQGTQTACPLKRLEQLAKYRGAAAGICMAEAFEVVRKIQ